MHYNTVSLSLLVCSLLNAPLCTAFRLQSKHSAGRWFTKPGSSFKLAAANKFPDAFPDNPVVDVYGEVNAPIDRVWALFRPFGKENLDWWKIYKNMDLEAPGKDEVGAVRSFEMIIGGKYRELLVIRDDDKHLERYDLVSADPPFPGFDAAATYVQMTAVGDKTKVRWGNSYEMKEGPVKEKVKALQTKAYTDGIEYLEQYFNPSVGALTVSNIQVSNLPGIRIKFPYTTLSVKGDSKQTTTGAGNSPSFNDKYALNLASTGSDTLTIAVLCASLVADSFVGQADIPLAGLKSGETKAFTVQLGSEGVEVKLDLALKMKNMESFPLPKMAAEAAQFEHLAGVFSQLKGIATAAFQDIAKGPQATWGYEKYPPYPTDASVPMDRLPVAVKGLPRTAILGVERQGRTFKRLNEFIYSQFDLQNRLQTTDPYAAHQGDYLVPTTHMIKHWKEDGECASHFINGMNPMTTAMVRSIDQVPARMRDLEYKGQSMPDLIAAKKLLVVDHPELTNVKPYGGMYCYPATGLIVSTGGGYDFVGIQLNEQLPVYSPTATPPVKWLLAKLHLKCASNQIMQFIWHLGLHHFLLEPFAVATHNSLPEGSPLRTFLAPHFNETIGINFVARQTLVSNVVPFTDKTFATGTAQALRIVVDAFEVWDWDKSSFPNQLLERGFDESESDGIKDYFYRSDGFKLWNIMGQYTSDFVDAAFSTDEDVAQDVGLKKWCSELTSPDKGNLASFPAVITTKSLLVKTLQNLIWKTSAGHAVLNYAQYDFGGYAPNYPVTMEKPMPDGDGDATQEYLQQSMPNKLAAVFATSFAHFLTDPSDRTLSGPKAFRPLCDMYPGITEKYEVQLEALSKAIQARSAAQVAEGQVPYPYLDPHRVPLSVDV